MKLQCPHSHVTDCVVSTNVTCEEIYTVCSNCGEITNTRIEC